MSILKQQKPVLLLAGDIIFLSISLWLMLILRYVEIPTQHIFREHIIPFSMLFVIWLLIFFIAGLYEKHTLILKNILPQVLFRTQVINSVVAVVFFYFIPYFGITPKTNLFLYLLISLLLMMIWRLYIIPLVVSGQQKQQAMLIGSGPEVKELHNQVNSHNQYSFVFNQSIDTDALNKIDFKEEVVNRVYSENISLIVADIRSTEVTSVLPKLYNLIFSRVQFIDIFRVYEAIFDRIPLSIIGYTWFLENISSRNHITYDAMKRLMDIFVSAILLIPTFFIIFPLIKFAIWLDDRGDAFIIQNRIGQGGKIIRLIKFRSMTVNDDGIWPEKADARVTRFGKFLRKSRLDEFPQLLNILKGDLSLIGPRPDMTDLFTTLKDQLPYYTIRNIVKPGLSGWAQINQEIPPHSIEETKIRLTYDLYYIKNRSFWLDLKIALRTLKTLVSRTGR